MRKYQQLSDTPLHTASREMNIPLVRRIFFHENKEYHLARSKEGRTFLHLLLVAVLLRRSKRSAELSNLCLAVNEILVVSPSLSIIHDNMGDTPLNVSIIIGNYRLVRIILDSVLASVVANGANNDFRNFLHLAIIKNVPSIVLMMVQPFQLWLNHYLNAEDQNGDKFVVDMICSSINNQKLKSLHALLTLDSFCTALNSYSTNKKTPLQSALTLFPTIPHSLISLLILRGAHVFAPYYCEDSNVADSAVSDCAVRGDTASIHILLHEAKHLRIEAKVAKSYFRIGGFDLKTNPLVCAVRSGSVDCLRAILEGNIFTELLNSQDISGHSPLSCACEMKSIACIQLLMDSGANPTASIDLASSGTLLFSVFVICYCLDCVCLLGFRT